MQMVTFHQEMMVTLWKRCITFAHPLQCQEAREEERLLLGEEDGEEVPPAQQPVDHAIPVPHGRAGRRPYHEIARENAEALNVLLTRELPQLTNQLQYTMEQMNQLIQRQLDN